MSKSHPKSTGGGTPQFILSWHFWGAALAGLALAILIFLHEVIGEAVFSTLGLGIIVFGLWIVAGVWVIWRRQFTSLKQRWNIWLAAIPFSVALLGIMALYHPSLSIAGVSLEDRTLAGSLGNSIAGTSHTWARLLVLILAGIMLVVPAQSLLLIKTATRKSWLWAHPRIAVFAARLWANLRKYTSILFTKIRLLATREKHRARSKTVKSAPVQIREAVSEPEPTGKQQALPGFTSSITEADEDQSNVEDVILPSIDRQLPPMEILDQAPKASFAQANDDDRARLIEDALGSYGVEVHVRQINPGPSVTQFGIEPGWLRKHKKIIEKDQNGKPILDKDGNPKFHMEEVSKTRVKVDRITSLSNDLALALAVSDIRIEAPVPGKALVGIEVPNVSTAIVTLRNVVESPVFKKAISKSRLATALGQGAGGEAVVGDLAKMPHVLIAGATGSGKSVCLNCIVSCLLSQTTPAEVRLILIDPKRVEMVTFVGVPHLLTPVIVDVDKAVEALRRVTMEMDRRYRDFANVGARNIETYNRNPKVSVPMPYIVVIIDELADLMMTAPDVAEPLICRLAQLARATGIHLIVATQRPSVDVITGLIKANFPTRISFAVVSSIDSRTILDATGAEKLLGRGDMLYI
ncbi:MAG: DNA translocase FtsK, partial [Chloroflexi bacterium]|nr:DNA translocase FtsK [Chloroflexota bacterium]